LSPGVVAVAGLSSSAPVSPIMNGLLCGALLLSASGTKSKL
jgi:hypothetical protein